MLTAAGMVALSSQASAVPVPKPRPIPRSVVPQSPPPIAKLPAPQSSAKATSPVSPHVPATPIVPPRAAAPRKLSAPLAVAPTSSTSRADMAALKQVIELVRGGKPQDATQLQPSISDPVARKLSEWIILRSPDNGASSDRYLAFMAANPSWPSQSFLRRRGESALWDDKRDDATVVAFLGNEPPETPKGKFMLARVLLGRGDRRGAERLVSDAWRNDSFPETTEESAREMFGALIDRGDDHARMDMLLYDNNYSGAMRAAKRLGSGYVALVKARMAVDKRASNAHTLLAAVPSQLHGDGVYILSRIQYLRRKDEIAEAGRLMLHAPREPSRIIDTNEWWIERRVLARELLDKGDYRMAYLVARDAAVPERTVYKTQHQFTAGWIALRFLNDPATAAQHFARISVNTANPTALARAGYWQGRAAEAAGRMQEARNAYQAAAAHPTSYYGQLARAKLHLPQIGINGPPGRSRAGERLEVVRAVALLYALNEDDAAVPILSDMGDHADQDALLALCELAERNHDARGLLLVGKAALNRGLPFDHYAYPVSGIPEYRDIGPKVEKAIVFAIARQESGFNPNVVSPAKAYGLMQVTPDAGKYVTRKYGAKFDLDRLKNDSSYNATLGAAELGGLIEDYRGSYIMTFAGYNAGRGSVRKWIARYGDPRDPNVDAVDWVERIPYSETRNYVQRIMENLQVYRSRFGGGSRLLIEADLRRGGAAE